MPDNDVVKRRFVEVTENHSFLGIKTDPEKLQDWDGHGQKLQGQLHGSLSLGLMSI